MAFLELSGQLQRHKMLSDYRHTATSNKDNSMPHNTAVLLKAVGLVSFSFINRPADRQFVTISQCAVIT
jgi:hypothetical protein